jgi:hypothetical protein
MTSSVKQMMEVANAAVPRITPAQAREMMRKARVWCCARRDPIVVRMLFQIEFFRCTNRKPQGETIRRNSGQFATERDAEIFGLTARPEHADGFRILKDGIVRKIVSIRTERQ